jgi:putative ABC transport system ATP-binding protein
MEPRTIRAMMYVCLLTRRLYRKEYESSAIFACKVVFGLKGLEDRRPNTLSGGQQQRISIARALVKKPTLVLADEPTANLDSHTATEIMELMKRMNEHYGTTFIFSTHDPLVMEYANRIVPLHDGLIVDQGVL